MESIPVKRSIHEKIENALYGHYGERSFYFGAGAGALIGVAAGSLPLAIGASVSLGLANALFGQKMFTGKGINAETGEEVLIKRSLNEKIDNFFVGMKGQRGWVFGALKGIDDGIGETIAGGLVGHIEHRRLLTGSAPAA